MTTYFQWTIPFNHCVYFYFRPAEGRVIQAEGTEITQREEKKPEPAGSLKCNTKTPYLPLTQACLIMHHIKTLQYPL